MIKEREIEGGKSVHEREMQREREDGRREKMFIGTKICFLLRQYMRKERDMIWVSEIEGD